MPLGEYISIVRLAPSAIRNERRHYVAIRGFFDGSGKSELHYKAITLAGISASEAVWPEFEQAWLDAVRGLGYKRWRTSTMHGMMTREAFCRAVGVLLDLLASFRDRPMVSYRSTVILDDYRRAKAEIPDLMRAEALCIDGCIGNLVFPTLEDVPAIIYFDRGEPFKSQIETIWRKRRQMFEHDWSRQIEDILETHWDRCGIQAADLFAWVSNSYEAIKRREDAEEEERAMLMRLSLHAYFVLHPTGMVYDYAKIVAAHERRRPK